MLSLTKCCFWCDTSAYIDTNKILKCRIMWNIVLLRFWDGKYTWIKRIGRNIVVLMRFWDRASQKDANCQSHSKIIWRKSEEKNKFLFLWTLFKFVFVWKRSCLYELEINIGLGLYLQLIFCCYNRNSYSNWIFIAFIILCQNFTDSLNLVLLHPDLMIKSTFF